MSGAAPVPRAVLFDLDGTLIDSAPDLAGATNELRLAHGLPVVPYATLRPKVGSGARGMLGAGFGIGPEDERFAALRDDFLRRYEARMTRETRIFPEVVPLLEALSARPLSWGIVTNKAQRFSAPIVEALGLASHSAILVSGDTTPYAKPHPEPLLEAARRLGVAPADCWYVGDDHRDVQAGRAAGMTTVVAAWGYLGAGEPVAAWGADHVIDLPGELLKLLGMA